MLTIARHEAVLIGDAKSSSSFQSPLRGERQSNQSCKGGGEGGRGRDVKGVWRGRPEPWGQLWPSRNTRSALCYPLPPVRPQALLAQSAPSPPHAGRCLAMSLRPSYCPSPHLKSLPPPRTLTNEKTVSLSSLDAPPRWAGQPGAWPTALEPACLGSDPTSAPYWLLTSSRCRIPSEPQCPHL